VFAAIDTGNTASLSPEFVSEFVQHLNAQGAPAVSAAQLHPSLIPKGSSHKSPTSIAEDLLRGVIRRPTATVVFMQQEENHDSDRENNNNNRVAPQVAPALQGDGRGTGLINPVTTQTASHASVPGRG